MNNRLGDDPLQDLTRRVHAISNKDKVKLKDICLDLLNQAQSGELTGDVLGLLTSLLSSEQNKDNRVTKLTANTVKFSDLEDLFELKMSKGPPWNLSPDQVIDPPDSIRANLDELADADYDPNSEATCRIAAEYLMVPATAWVKRKMSMYSNLRQKNKRKRVSSTSCTRPTKKSRRPSAASSSLTPSKVSAPIKHDMPTKVLKIFPEFELEISLPHPESGAQFEVSGKADWVACYGDRRTAQEGSVMLCVKAKQMHTFSQAAEQLICYLAICRYIRQQQKKLNCSIQGFTTDGTNYQFFCLLQDGTIKRSRAYDVREPSDLKLAFSWVVAQLRTTAYASPSTSPVKTEKEKEKVKIATNFEKKVLASVFDGIQVFEDDDEANTVSVKFRLPPFA